MASSFESSWPLIKILYVGGLMTKSLLFVVYLKALHFSNSHIFIYTYTYIYTYTHIPSEPKTLLCYMSLNTSKQGVVGLRTKTCKTRVLSLLY